MYELIIQKIQVAISTVLMSVAWIISQFPILEQGYDQLFSIGLLITAVVVIWKAFSAKDASETKILRDTIDVQQKHIEAQDKMYQKQQEMYEDLQDMFKDLQESIRKEK